MAARKMKCRSESAENPERGMVVTCSVVFEAGIGDAVVARGCAETAILG